MRVKSLGVIAGLVLSCLSLSLFLSLSPSSFSQELSEEVVLAQIELARAVGRDETRTVIDTAMQLSDDEAQVFWPVFDEYMQDIFHINDRLLALIQDYAELYNSGMPEGAASSMIVAYFDIESDRIDVKQRHLANFQRVLPDEKVFLFFQLDNRLQNLINLGLSSEIPLINE